MPRPKKDKTATSTGDHKTKSMILALEPDLHGLVKKISDKTELAQPKVITYILESVKGSAEDFIRQLTRLKVEKERKELLAQKQQIDKKLESLGEDLA